MNIFNDDTLVNEDYRSYQWSEGFHVSNRIIRFNERLIKMYNEGSVDGSYIMDLYNTRSLCDTEAHEQGYKSDYELQDIRERLHLVINYLNI